MSVTVSGAFVRLTFTGPASAGPVSAPGLQVGDALIFLFAPGNFDYNICTYPGYVEGEISVNDELQFLSAGYSGWTFNAIFVRGGN